ncbi:hypothetical protein C1645_762346 [Glomus cerebriforme]|uniref:Uncharacterized protein n=1 Tax=Glomus cerebriforme TaxID=658196 RepID=A0A397T5M5_9GLOM|nr:hypothetical protein C1645_762346 [Glomus cerebriforme]
MKYCSKCQDYKYVTNSDNYCPTCGTAFGTLAKTSFGDVVNIINKSAEHIGRIC